ncbi:MAG: DNA-3-methyladenine glycosylase [Bacteroidota bacterium]
MNLIQLSSKLPREFYLQPTLVVARSLLGAHIVSRVHGTELVGKIVEVEAYIGFDDPGSHAYRGETRRNAVMYGLGGHAYVYFTYGMHYCFNVVTEREGFPAAVLIRAVEPEKGINVMRKFRGDSIAGVDLANGPAKFCQAFGIDRRLNGEDLLGERLFIVAAEHPVETSEIIATPRIGIRQGLDRNWRFFLKGNPYVSKARPFVNPE